MNRYFTEKDIQMASKHVKRCSTLLVIKKYKVIPPKDMTTTY